MSLFVGFISCCNCRKLREEVCLCWFSVRTGSRPWNAKRLCNFFHLIWRSLKQHTMLLFHSARRATPHCSVSLLILCFFAEQSSRSWGRWEWEKGETLGTLSNHRMTVNHHCRTLKGKDNSKCCSISSSDREVLIPWMVQCSSRISFGCQRALWPSEFKSVLWQEVEKLVSFKKITANAE